MSIDEDIVEARDDGHSAPKLAEFALQLKTLTTQQAQLEKTLTRHFEALMAKIDAQSGERGTNEELYPPAAEGLQKLLTQMGPDMGIASTSMLRNKRLQKLHRGREFQDFEDDCGSTVPNRAWNERLLRFASSLAFESIVGLVIVGNMVCMGIRVHLEGICQERSLGLSSGCGQHLQWITGLARLEVAFICIYWLEMFFRAWVMRMAFVKSVVMLYELCAVLLSTVEVIADLASLDLSLPNFAPILRITRALRLTKIIRIMAVFPELNVVLCTIKKSIAPLGWGMLVLFVTNAFTSLLMVNLLQGLIGDETEELSLRHWAYEHFGTTARSMLTMLESTFSPKWLAILRIICTDISLWLAALWLVYGLIVNFAAIRLVASLFVKSAMSADKSEQQRAAIAKRAEIQRNAKNIYRMIKAMDSSGDGKLQRSEVEEFMLRESTEKRDFFDSVDLNEEEALAIFDLASGDSDEVDFEDFIGMATSIRNPVQNIDTMRILSEQTALNRKLDAMSDGMRQLLGSMGNPRQARRQAHFKAEV